MTAATSSQLLWYTTRATGVVALVLLTGSVVLGVLTSVRFGTAGWPRFTFQDLHRRVSLLSVVFVALHVVTTVTDSFAPIGWLSALVPFTSPYRRLWLGLGTASVDVLLAVTVSSLLRRWVSTRTWRALHWLAYASWPLAIVHGLGTGTDPHLRWMVLLTVACVATVLGAVGWRVVAGWPVMAGRRVAVSSVGLVAVVALAAWTITGPLRPGWAARAGTPRALLAGARVASTPSTHTGRPSPPSSTVPTTAPAAASFPSPPYQASLTGTITQRPLSASTVEVDIATRTSGALDALVHVVITGTGDGAGGVAMQQSEATFGPPGAPSRYRGRIVELEGTHMVLALTGPTGAVLELRLDLSISGGDLTGQLRSIADARSAGGPR